MKSLIIVTLALSAILPNCVKAGDKSPPPPEPEVIEIFRTVYDIRYTSMGAAAGLASSQAQFDWTDNRWQGNMSLGHYHDDTAISFSIGKKIDNAVFLNFTVTQDENYNAGAAGISWKF